MHDDFSADDAIEFVSGGFAAAATDSENVTPEVLARLNVHDKKSHAAGVVASSFVGLIAGHLIGSGIAHSAKLAAIHSAAGAVLFPEGSIQSACKQIKNYILGRGRPVTQEEFNVALEYDWLFRLLRPILKDYAQKHNMTADKLYRRTIDAIDENPAYKYISDDDKDKLAKRLTDGLVSK